MIVGVPKESYPGERRVALTPTVVPLLAKAGLEVVLESGAGESAGYPDARYQEHGAKILPERGAVFAQSDIVVQVLCHGANDKTGASDLSLMRQGQVLVGFLRPLGSPDSVQQVAVTKTAPFRPMGGCNNRREYLIAATLATVAGLSISNILEALGNHDNSASYYGLIQKLKSYYKVALDINKVIAYIRCHSVSVAI